MENGLRAKRLESEGRELQRANREGEERISQLIREQGAISTCLRSEVFTVEKLTLLLKHLTQGREISAYIKTLEKATEKLLTEKDSTDLKMDEVSKTLATANSQISSLKKENKELKNQGTHSRQSPASSRSSPHLPKQSSADNFTPSRSTDNFTPSRSADNRTPSRSAAGSARTSSCGDLVKEFGRVKDQLLQANADHEEALCQYLQGPPRSASRLKLGLGRLESEIVQLEQEKSQIEEELYLTSKDN